MQGEKLKMLTKTNIVILQPARNFDLKDVILSVSEESHFFSSNQKRDPSALRPQDDKESESMLTITLFVILSVSEESHTSIEFLAQKHYYL
jgi:hypothetical protein